jgi:hypothetical protein
MESAGVEEGEKILGIAGPESEAAAEAVAAADAGRACRPANETVPLRFGFKTALLALLNDGFFPVERSVIL